MKAIMNELEYATDLMNGGKIKHGDTHALETLAKYCRYFDLDKTQTRQTLNSWYKERFPDRPKSQCYKEIERAIKIAAKYPLVAIDEINVTKPEIERILAIKSPPTREDGRRGLNAKSLQKLAFTLLCFAKFELAKGRSEPWVNIPYKDLFRISRVRVVNDLKIQYLKDLKDLGLIKHTMRASSFLLKVLFIEDGDTALTVSDLNELGALFEQIYFGIRYLRCGYCGKIIKRNGRRKYCTECAKKVNAQKALENMRRNRARDKATAQKAVAEN